MKAIISSILILFTISCFSQTEGKKTLLMKNDMVTVYLLGKDSVDTNKNKLWIISHTKKDYQFMLTGGMIMKDGDFWVIKPVRSVKRVILSVFTGSFMNPNIICSQRIPVILSPQEKRRRELGMK